VIFVEALGDGLPQRTSQSSVDLSCQPAAFEPTSFPVATTICPKASVLQQSRDTSPLH
jgi:hypothetical protein